MTKPGEEPMARSDSEADLASAEPGTPKQPKEAPHIEVPISIVESAENFISPKPDGEAESEAEFGEKLQAAARKANAGNSTPDAMSK